MCDFGACFTLDRFSDDQIRTIFKCGEDSAGREFWFRRLHEKQLVNTRIFLVQVRKVVNDTRLPELQIEDENQEISFDWRGMLDQLMGEEHVFNTILSQRLGWHLGPGEDNPNLLEMHRKLARRSRLQRECRAKYRSNILDHYVQDETPALQNIQMLASLHRVSRVPLVTSNSTTTTTITKTILLCILDKRSLMSSLMTPSSTAAIVVQGQSQDQSRAYSLHRSRLLLARKPMEGSATAVCSESLLSTPPRNLSWGREPIDPPQEPKWKGGLDGKRARDGKQAMIPKNASI